LGILQAASAFSIPTLGAALCILLPDGSQVTSSDPGSGTSGDFSSQPSQSCACQAGEMSQAHSATTVVATAHWLLE
jgi:hypothetical protein